MTINDKWTYSQWLTVALGLILTLRMFYPGLLSSDSVDQYSQAIHFSFSDWHPPVMAFVWAVVNDWIPGPFGMLFLHSLLYWGAILLFSLSIRPLSNFWSLCVIALGYSPFAIGMLGSIWKDVFHAVFFFFAVALIVFEKERHLSRPGLVVAIVLSLLVIGGIARFNAIAALPPLTWLVIGRPCVRSWKTLGIIFILIPSAVLTIGIGFNYGFLRAERTGVQASLMTYDLGAISHLRGKNVFEEPFPLEQNEMLVKSCYVPVAWDTYAWGKCAFVVQTLKASGSWGGKLLARNWISAIRESPLEYVSHRIGYWNNFLWRSDGFLLSEMEKNPWGFRFTKSALHASLERVAEMLRGSVFYKPGFWGVVAIVLWLVGSIAPKSLFRDVANALCASSILYLLSYLPSGVASDFRYAYWSILATMISLPLLGASFCGKSSFGNDPSLCQAKRKFVWWRSALIERGGS